MPIDPQAQSVLDLLLSAGRPPLETLTPAEAREVARSSSLFFALPPEDVAAAADRIIPGPGGPIRVRLYRPAGSRADALLPVLVYFHGGGFVIGDLDTHDGICRILANRAGCAVLAVHYRLAPEHPFPAAVEDSWAAVEWVRAQGHAAGLDPARIAVGGDSAGGNLAAVMALLARDAKLPLAFQLLIYPVTDFAGDTPSSRAFADGYFLTRSSMDWFSGHYLQRPGDALDWRASPLRAASLAGVAPALVLTAGFDPLLDEGKAYADRLREAGIAVRYRCYDGQIHAFVGMTKLVEEGSRALGECGAAVKAGFAASGVSPARSV
jgi:acetyl esterase